MSPKKIKDAECIQQLIAQRIATYPVGRNLALIGGFRYRHLDGSVRKSNDIDYHWAGDLVEKQHALLAFFRRILLPEVSRRFGYSGRADIRKGPDAQSSLVRVVDLVFWKNNIHDSRIEIPVEVTRILCVDPIEVRTLGGIIFATVSEGDMIESKIMALLNRPHMRHRDLVDVFLFQDRLPSDADQRLTQKCRALNVSAAHIEKRLSDLQIHGDYHVKAVQAIIDSQVQTDSAAQLNDAGGGRVILTHIIALLEQLFRKGRSHESH